MRAARCVAVAADAVVSVALIGCVLYFGYAQFYRAFHAVLLLFLLLLGGVFSSAVCCIFHELGHVLFGALCGFRFVGMRAACFRLYRSGGKMHACFSALPASLAGATEMIPKHTRRLRGRYLAFLAGGLIFSLLFLAGAAVAFGFFARVPFAVYALVCTALPAAFHLFFVNVLPVFEGTDGASFFGVLRGDPSCAVALRILAIEGGMYEGRTPSELDPKLFFAPPNLPEDDVYFLLLTDHRLTFYLDAGDAASAAKETLRLDELLEYAPPYYSGALAADVLFGKCCVLRDTEGALVLYSRYAAVFAGAGTVSSERTVAAFEWYVKGDRAAAGAALARARRLAETSIVAGEARFEGKLLDRIAADVARPPAGEANAAL